MLLPEPALNPPADGALVPNASLHEPGLVELYLNHDVVAPLFGLTVPFNVAEVAVILVAAFVVTVGAETGFDATKERTEPIPVPPEFEAIAQ